MLSHPLGFAVFDGNGPLIATSADHAPIMLHHRRHGLAAVHSLPTIGHLTTKPHGVASGAESQRHSQSVTALESVRCSALGGYLVARLVGEWVGLPKEAIR